MGDLSTVESTIVRSLIMENESRVSVQIFREKEKCVRGGEQSTRYRANDAVITPRTIKNCAHPDPPALVAVLFVT